MADGGHLHGPAESDLAEPRAQGFQEFLGKAVAVARIALHEATQWGAGDDAEVPVEGPLVFLIGDQRVDFPVAHQRDMPGFASPEVFLEKNSLGVIDPR